MLSSTVRAQFPALGPADHVYLDSASTTQKPTGVIDAISRYHSEGTANVGRGAYSWANRLTLEVERIRERFAAFIGAAGRDEIVFTSGATAALNAVALSWGMRNLTDGDEILFSPADHASNVFPWHRIAGLLSRFGISILLVPYGIDATGAADIDDLVGKVTSRTRLIAVSHLHHMYGAVSTLRELRGRIDPSILRCFDCSQSAGHVPVDVEELGADFAIFAAHKMFGAPGTGVLYCRRSIHPTLDPFLPGGQSGVRLDNGTLHGTAMPDLLEGGTPNIPGILALDAALDFVEEIGIPAIVQHNQALTERLLAGLRPLPGIRVLPGNSDRKHGIASFRLAGISAADIGFALNSYGFMVRTGNHCVPGSDDSVRVSCHIYNSIEEIDRFVDQVGRLSVEAHR